MTEVLVAFFLGVGVGIVIGFVFCFVYLLFGSLEEEDYLEED